MSKYSNVFDDVGRQEDLGDGYEPNLPAGRHRLALTKFGGKLSTKDKSVFVEAEFVVASSNNPEVTPGDKHSWPWFINMPSWTGKYAKDRLKKFCRAAQGCLGNTDEPAAFGDALAEDFEADAPTLRGLLIDCVVTQVFEKDGSPKVGASGREVYNAVWFAVPDQDADTVTESQAALAELESAALAAAPKAPTKAAAAPAKAVAPAAAAPAPAIAKKTAGLGALLKKRDA